ncbi:TPA: hypothetical protein RPW20_000723 [Campylobacter fetus subsp. venerealis]|nr:hypothetical protein [Campylobacter fetus subsp. venerealis]HDX6324078.1 hypothetical protein [Campylobacter fetus subsp. venerealis]
MPMVFVYGLFFVAIYCIDNILNFGYKHYFLAFLLIAIPWYIYAKFLGLKGRECLWAPDFLLVGFRTLVAIAILVMCVGFMFNFFHQDLPIFAETVFPWKQIISGILLFSGIFISLGYVREGHKPEKLIDFKNDNLKEELSETEKKE